MSGSESYVIAGASLAGAKAAEALRDGGFGGPVILIGDEDERPYERPPLSKDYLLGKAERDTIYVHPADWYAGNDVSLRLGTTVTGIDRAAHQVALDDGSQVGYAKLLLTTGSSPRRLDVPGAGLDGVHYLRRASDSDQIKKAFQAAVPGRGHRGRLDRPGDRGRRPHRGRRGDGAGIRRSYRCCGCSAGKSPRCSPRCTPSTAWICGAVCRWPRSPAVAARPAGCGSATAATSQRMWSSSAWASRPTPSWPRRRAWRSATASGSTRNCAPRDPDIYAAGDVANAFHPLLGTHIRVEHWANALHQPHAAARAMLGQVVSYDRLPYFFTDQYDLGMEYSGYVAPGGYDEVVLRGDVPGREFIAFWLAGGRVLAGMNVNVWDVTDAIQALVRSGQPVDTARLADPEVALTELAAG